MFLFSAVGLVCLCSQLLPTPVNCAVPVNVVSSSLSVTEGEVVSVCVLIDRSIPGFFSRSIFPQPLPVTVQFLTADAADISPGYPSVLMLTAASREQCIGIATVRNNDGERMSETFAVIFSGTSEVTFNRARTVVTILEVVVTEAVTTPSSIATSSHTTTNFATPDIAPATMITTPDTTATQDTAAATTATPATQATTAAPATQATTAAPVTQATTAASATQATTAAPMTQFTTAAPTTQATTAAPATRATTTAAGTTATLNTTPGTTAAAFPNITVSPLTATVSGGDAAVVCISVEFPSQWPPEELLVLLAIIQGIRASSGDDEEDWQFPDFIWLGVHNASHCLSIRILPTGLAATRLHILIGPHSVLLTILPCAEGTVRLVGGGDEREGRLEVCRHGLYGTVCNTSWTMDNTHVVCNQLGFSAKGGAVTSIYGEGSGPIVLDEVNCTGSEADILSCPSSSSTTTCSHSMDIGLNCSTRQFDGPGCVLGDVLPLIGGSSPSEGLVEVCTDRGYHFPIDTETFTIREANVLCRQLKLGSAGFPLSTAADLEMGLLDLFSFMKDEVAVIQCSGSEDSLAECSMRFTRMKRTSVDFAAVACIEAADCSDGEFRLVPVPDSEVSVIREGRVEICYQGVWGAVFDTDWSAMDAAVTCQQLGFQAKGALPVVAAVYPNEVEALPVTYDFPACDSTEYASLLACPREPIACPTEISPAIPVAPSSRSGIGGNLGTLTAPAHIGRRAYIGVVGVSCDDYPETGCREFDLRLTYRKRTTAAGNAEICFGNRWNKLCSGSFGEKELSVACRALGFALFERDTINHRFIPATVTTPGAGFEQTLNCSGFESHFSECPVEATPSPEDANICRDMRIECLAPPRILLRPVLYSSTLVVEEHRAAALQCVVDGASYPPVSQLVVRPQRGVREGKREQPHSTVSYCASASMYVTANASLRDTGLYSCIVRSGGRLSSRSVRVSVKGPDFPQATPPEYLRFSAVQDMLPLSVQSLVFGSIGPRTAGQQRVQCHLVPTRPAEEVAGRQRFECTILQFGSPIVGRNSSVSGIAADVLHRLHPLIFTINTSASGFCDYSETRYQGSIYKWPESVGRDVILLPCPSRGGHLTRMCSGDGEGWLPVNTTACDNLDSIIMEISNFTVTEAEYEDQVHQVSGILQQTLEEPQQQSDALLDVLAGFFEEVAETATTTTTAAIPAEVLEGYVDSLGSLQQWEAAILSSSPSTARIVKSFETTAAQFSQQLENTAINIAIPNHIVFAAESRDVETLQRTGRTATLGNNTIVRGVNGPEPPSLTTGVEASISLPPNTFTPLSNRTRVGLFFALYYSAALFPLRSPETTSNSTPQRAVLASPVLATKIAGAGDRVTNITPPVQIELRISQQDSEVLGSEECVFWDFAGAGGRGNWSSDGCTLVSRNSDIVTCQCSHLTNFAILVDICTRVGECRDGIVVEQLLSLITYIGVAFSTLGLVLSIGTLLAFRKLRQREATAYHLQLCVAMLCMMLVFVAGIDQTAQYGSCVAVSVLLHYFTLVAVAWMTAEAVLMFKKLVFVFEKTSRNFVLVVSVVSWGVPVVPVLIPLVIDLAQGNAPSNDLIIRRDEFCFLSNSIVFWASFMGPIFAVLLVNLVEYVVVIGILLKHTRSAMVRRRERLSTMSTLRLLASVGSIIFLFGLSWLFGAMTITVPGIRTAAQILFAVSNAFQGVFLFLFFCVLNQDARESWKEFLSCGRYKSKVLHPHLRSSSYEGGSHRKVRSSTIGTGGRVIRGFDSIKKDTSCYHSKDTLKGSSAGSLDNITTTVPGGLIPLEVITTHTSSVINAANLTFTATTPSTATPTSATPALFAMPALKKNGYYSSDEKLSDDKNSSNDKDKTDGSDGVSGDGRQASDAEEHTGEERASVGGGQVSDGEERASDGITDGGAGQWITDGGADQSCDGITDGGAGQWITDGGADQSCDGITDGGAGQSCDGITDGGADQWITDGGAGQSGGGEHFKGKPMKARVHRYSTIKGQHHVEEYQVDFYNSSSEDEGTPM